MNAAIDTCYMLEEIHGETCEFFNTLSAARKAAVELSSKSSRKFVVVIRRETEGSDGVMCGDSVYTELEAYFKGMVL